MKTEKENGKKKTEMMTEITEDVVKELIKKAVTEGDTEAANKLMMMTSEEITVVMALIHDRFILLEKAMKNAAHLLSLLAEHYTLQPKGEKAEG